MGFHFLDPLGGLGNPGTTGLLLTSLHQVTIILLMEEILHHLRSLKS